MMRRRASVALLAGVLLAGLVTVPGSPAGAQNGTDLLDLPRLGFEIDPTQGNVGDVAGAQVDPDDVAEHCLSVTEIYDSGPPESGELASFAFTFYLEYLIPVQLGERLPPGGLSLQEFDAALGPLRLLLAATADPDNLLTLWENLFVLTFVDPVTTEMVGPMGGFDPISGQGEIVVPELDPGLYAVAAACVGFIADDEFLLAEGGTFDQIAVLLHEWITINYPDGPPPLGGFPPSEEFIAFVLDAAMVWLPEVVEPLAIGIDFYCILQDDGYCATPPGPVGLIDEDVLDEFNGDGPGDDPLAPGPGAESLDGTADLVAVEAAPSFTG